MTQYLKILPSLVILTCCGPNVKPLHANLPTPEAVQIKRPACRGVSRSKGYRKVLVLFFEQVAQEDLVSQDDIRKRWKVNGPVCPAWGNCTRTKGKDCHWQLNLINSLATWLVINFHLYQPHQQEALFGTLGVVERVRRAVFAETGA